MKPAIRKEKHLGWTVRLPGDVMYVCASWVRAMEVLRQFLLTEMRCTNK